MMQWFYFISRKRALESSNFKFPMSLILSQEFTSHPHVIGHAKIRFVKFNINTWGGAQLKCALNLHLICIKKCSSGILYGWTLYVGKNVGFGKWVWRCTRVASGTQFRHILQLTFKQQIFMIFYSRIFLIMNFKKSQILF